MHTSALLLLPLLGTVLVSATQYQARSSLDLNDGFLEILARDIQSREANLAVARRNLESEIQNKYYRRSPVSNQQFEGLSALQGRSPGGRGRSRNKSGSRANRAKNKIQDTTQAVQTTGDNSDGLGSGSGGRTGPPSDLTGNPSVPGSNSEGGELLGVEAPPAGAGTRITPPARLGGSAGSPSTPPRRADHEGTAGELSGPPRPLKRRSFDSLEEEELLDFYIREFMDDDN